MCKVDEAGVAGGGGARPKTENKGFFWGGGWLPIARISIGQPNSLMGE